MKKTALITGASSGIGWAISKALIEEGWRVFGSLRKPEDGQKAQDALGPNFNPLLFDVTDAQAIERAAAEVEKALNGETLSALINNAGIAVAGPWRYIDLEEVKHQFAVNLYGVVSVTQAFLPHLGADERFKGAPGKIINMSSVAGKIASPIMGPYSASKHALEGYSESLRREVLMHGIDVIIIGPGAIKTPIWDKADDINAELYKHTEYYDTLIGMRKKLQEVGENGLAPEEVGALALKILNNTNPKTRYVILKEWLTSWTLPRVLPDRLVDKIIVQRFGLSKKNLKRRKRQ